MKFLHTADWQIGMKADFVGKAVQIVRDERLAAGKRLVDAANNEGAEFILIAGDLFEDNAVERTLIQRIVDILTRFHGPVYLIPGNHDPLVPGSVWDHPAWRSAQNLFVLTEAKPVEIPGGILFPCPVLDKYSRKDPTAWITVEPGDIIRLALAHGNVEGLPQADPDHPIPRDAIQRANLDYLALGHWHSTATYPDSKGSVRMAYSGTPETARFGERDSGHALVVEIIAPGAAPDVRPIQTGRLKWQILESDIGTPGDLKTLRQNLEGIDSPEALLHALPRHRRRRLLPPLPGRQGRGFLPDLRIPTPRADSRLAGHNRIGPAQTRAHRAGSHPSRGRHGGRTRRDHPNPIHGR